MYTFLLTFIIFLFSSITCLAEEIKIGVLSENSGPFSSYGEDCRRGYTIAQKYVLPQNSLKILFGDHKREAKVGLNEFNRMTLIENVIGIASSATPVVMALNPVSQSRRIPIIGIAAHPNFLDNPYSFRFWFNASKEGSMIAQKANAMKIQRVAVVTVDDDYTLQVTRGFINKFKELGGDVVANEQTLISENNFSPLVAKIKKTKPEAIFVNYIGDQLAIVVKKFKESGMNQQLFTPYSISKKEILENVGRRDAEGIVFMEVDPRKPEYSAKMKIEYGDYTPTGFSYACYASLSMLGEAFKRNAEIKTSFELYQELLKISEISLLDEKLKMVKREAQLDPIFRIIRDGRGEDLVDN